MELMAKYILNSGGKRHTNNLALGLTASNKNAILLKTKKEHAFDLVIKCSGLFSDRIHAILTSKKDPLKLFHLGRQEQILQKRSFIK